jgi:subtilase family serine protease
MSKFVKNPFVLIVGGLIGIAVMYYASYKVVRWWNWNVGGYGAAAETVVCEMAKKGVVTKGPNWSTYCD